MSLGDGSIVFSIRDNTGAPLGTIGLVPDKYAAGVPVSYRVATLTVKADQDPSELYCSLLTDGAALVRDAGGRRVHVPVRPGHDTIYAACDKVCELVDGVRIIASFERGGL